MYTMTKTWWDELEKLYPIGVRAFRQWVDDYKKQVGWEARIKVKVHELPDNLQEAIAWKWLLETGGDERSYPELTAHWMKSYSERKNPPRKHTKTIVPPPGKKRGRKPGSKNKPKANDQRPETN